MQICNYKVEKLCYQNVQTAKKLCDEYVGVNLYNTDFLNSLVGKQNHLFYLIFEENEPVGYFYCYYTSFDEIFTEQAFDDKTVRTLFEKDNKIGIYQSIGINKRLRGNGLTDDLMEYFENILFVFGCSIILVPAWKLGDYIPAKKLLKRNGYKFFCNMPNPWKNNETLNCPHCKKEICTCDTALFFLRSSKTEGEK